MVHAMLRFITTLTLAATVATGCSAGIGAEAAPFAPLVRSMAARINTADQVALSKWDTG